MEEKREEIIINEGLTIQTLIDKVNSYNKGEITPEEFNSWGGKLTVITNLPMLKKVNILTDIVERHVYNNMEMKEFVICELYRNIFFYLYLGGYLGIINIDPDYVNYSNYDLLEPIFGPWIEQVAGRDIKTVKEMIDKSLQFYNVAQLTDVINLVNLDELKEATDTNKHLIRVLDNNEENIKNLRDIQAYNSPLVSDMVEQIQNAATKK